MPLNSLSLFFLILSANLEMTLSSIVSSVYSFTRTLCLSFLSFPLTCSANNIENNMQSSAKVFWKNKKLKIAAIRHPCTVDSNQIMQNDPLRSRPGVVAVTQHFCFFFFFAAAAGDDLFDTDFTFKWSALFQHEKKRKQLHIGRHTHTRVHDAISQHRGVYSVC